MTDRPHLTEITYKWHERLRFRLFGRWPESVVERRLDAYERDLRAMRAETARRSERS